ncbi:hypothetical protein HYU95_01460 [Candidatus Daviesbacteria bacterium]|nr:hypothetical protein [Candidatus Daviesbacteria bacterium]
MNIFGNTKSNNTNKSILGGALGFFNDEGDFEKETSLFSNITSSVASVAKDMAGGVYEAAADLSQTVITTESKTESNGKFPKSGSLEGFNNPASSENKKQALQYEQLLKQKTETDRKKAFFQALKEESVRTERAKEKALEEEIDDIITNLPTEQKNQLLHYQASYKDRSIYQKAELRKKLIEEQKKADKQKKADSIPSPAKQPSAMEGAFEGRSGTQGGGTANLSNQAVG